MFFVAVCWDRPNVGETRERTHPDHLRYMKGCAANVCGGGPMESADGATVGTLFLLDFEREADARSFLDEEPFHKARCFESSQLRRYRQMQPAVEPGAGQVAAAAAELALKQEGLL